MKHTEVIFFRFRFDFGFGNGTMSLGAVLGIASSRVSGSPSQAGSVIILSSASWVKWLSVWVRARVLRWPRRPLVCCRIAMTRDALPREVELEAVEVGLATRKVVRGRARFGRAWLESSDDFLFAMQQSQPQDPWFVEPQRQFPDRVLLHLATLLPVAELNVLPMWGE